MDVAGLICCLVTYGAVATAADKGKLEGWDTRLFLVCGALAVGILFFLARIYVGSL